MLKTALAACFVLCAFLSTGAEARHRQAGCVEAGTVMRPHCMGGNAPSVRHKKHRVHRARTARLSRHSKRVSHRHVHRHRSPAPSYTAGIVPTLAAKVAEIQSSCGSKVVSGVRHTRIAGTRRMSLHASGKAVDLAGNPSCMYAMLHGWPGGYSTDYGSVRHLHLSYDPAGGREMGIRFRHGGHRYARRHHRHARYASAR